MLQETATPSEAPTTSTTATTTRDLAAEIEAVDDITDPHEAAVAVFTRLQTTGRLRLLLPALTNLIANHRRNHVRELEHAVVAEAEQEAARAARQRKPAPARSHIRSLRELLAESFFTGERWVAYSEAVADDYRASVDYLRRKVEGLERTIAFRVLCAQVIEAHEGAKTLAQIPDEVLADVWAQRS